MARRLKLAEIFVAASRSSASRCISVPILFVALFLFGLIAALFGPIKYGILPDHLARAELPAGNALIEGATFIAILLGTIVGGFVARRRRRSDARSALMIMIFAVACAGARACSSRRPARRRPISRVHWNIAASTGRSC